MSESIFAASAELIKIAAEESKKQSPLRAIQLAAPVAAAQALADVPKGAVDKLVEGKLNTGKFPKAKEVLNRGFSRGAGRLSVGLATTPAFISGIRDLQSDDKKKKRTGAAKLLTASAVYGAGKGAIEGIGEHGLSSKALQKVRSIARVRGGISIAQGALTAATVAKSTQRKKGEKRTFGQRVGLPVVAGASIGAVKGAIEKADELKYKKLMTPKNVRGIASKAAGRSAAGALGTLALSEIMDRALNVKTAAVEMKDRKDVNLGPSAGELYSGMREWAETQEDDAVLRQFKSTVKRGEPELTPTRRAVYYALHDDMVRRGHKPPPPKMRDQTHPPRTRSPGTADVAMMAGFLAAPTLVWNIGISRMRPSDKDAVLQDALDRMIAAKGIRRVQASKDFWGNAEEAYGIGTKDVYLGVGDQIAEGQVVAPHTPTRISKPSIMAHEMGHATASALRKRTIGSATARAVGEAARLPAVLLPLLAIDSFRDKSFATDRELESKARFVKVVGVVSAVAQAPMLAEEAAASIKAVGFLTEAGDTMQGALKRGAKTLLPAYATYLAPAVLPFIVAGHLNRKAKAARKQARKER